MQGFMILEKTDIGTVQQPVNLLVGQRHRVAGRYRPSERPSARGS